MNSLDNSLRFYVLLNRNKDETLIFDALVLTLELTQDTSLKVARFSLRLGASKHQTRQFENRRELRRVFRRISVMTELALNFCGQELPSTLFKRDC